MSYPSGCPGSNPGVPTIYLMIPDYLLKEVINKNHTISEIANIFNVGDSTIRYWLKKYDLKTNNKQKPRLKKPNIKNMVISGNNNEEYCYLLGLYLGDGHIVQAKNKRSHKLRFFLDDKYPKIKNECKEALIKLTSNKVSECRKSGCGEIICYSTQWLELFPQHGPGKKHERHIILEDWQQKIVQENPKPFVKGLIHSDGSRTVNSGRVQYEFCNVSADILDLFKWGCNLVNVKPTGPYKKQNKNGFTYNIIRKTYSKILDEFIGPKS